MYKKKKQRKNKKSPGRLFLSDNLHYPAYNRVGVESFHFLKPIIGINYVQSVSKLLKVKTFLFIFSTTYFLKILFANQSLKMD